MNKEKSLLWGLGLATLGAFYYGGKTQKGLIYFALILIAAYILMYGILFDAKIFRPEDWFAGPRESKLTLKP